MTLRSIYHQVHPISALTIFVRLSEDRGGAFNGGDLKLGVGVEFRPGKII